MMAESIAPLSEYRPSTALRQPEWSEYVWRLEQELATARRQRDERPAGRVVRRKRTRAFDEADPEIGSFVTFALSPEDAVPVGTEVALVVPADNDHERPAGRVVWSGQFYELTREGDPRPPFDWPDVPPGTDVAVVVVADDSGTPVER